MWTAAASWDALSTQLLLNVWSNLLAFENELSEWMQCDADVMPFAILSDTEIIDMVNQAQESDHSSNSEDEETEIETPTLLQPIEACNVLLKFVENSPAISETDKIQMHRIQNHLFKEQLKTMKQTNIKEYFK